MPTLQDHRLGPRLGPRVYVRADLGQLVPRVEEHPRAARGRPRPQPEPRSSLGCGCLTTEAPPRLGSSSVMNSLGLPEARIELG